MIIFDFFFGLTLNHGMMEKHGEKAKNQSKIS